MSKTLEEVMEEYTVVVGLEVHAQLLTNTKVFSSDKNEYGSLPNSNVSAISLGHPGTLPRLNKKVLDHAIRLGLAVGADIRRDMYFARKNYFYADLPKGYQITQDTTPICNGGHITIELEDGSEKNIQLTRIHIEEDAGKSIHDIDPFNSLIDLNRAGVPLLEIVSEPELRSPKEAYNYLTEVRKLVRYLDVCDGNMEEGSLRCDANISIMKKGATQFGNRCEVKNMNSIRNVQRAIEVEIVRQAEIIENGGTIDTETRSYDATNNSTFSLRSKEAAHDYRYFPEPDLQPVHLKQTHIDAVEADMPPLPRELFKKYTGNYGLSEYDAKVLTDTKPVAMYFEALTEFTKEYKEAANWVTQSIKSYLNTNAIGIDRFPISPEKIAALIAFISTGKISKAAAASRLFPLMCENPDQAPAELAAANDLIQESDEGSITGLIEEVFNNHPAEVERYKGGEKKLMGFFMGQVMKASRGKADPGTTTKLIREMLED